MNMYLELELTVFTDKLDSVDESEGEWDSCSTQIPVDPFKQFCVQLLPPFWCTSASKSQYLRAFFLGGGDGVVLLSSYITGRLACRCRQLRAWECTCSWENH